MVIILMKRINVTITWYCRVLYCDLFFYELHLSKLYKETFQNTSNYPTLQEALAEYSDAVPFFDHISRNDNETELVKYSKNIFIKIFYFGLL